MRGWDFEWSLKCLKVMGVSHMSDSILHFLCNYPNVDCLEMKCSIPGHVTCQEVDNIQLSWKNIWPHGVPLLPFIMHNKRSQKNSQYSLVWTILKANRKTPFNVIQMKSNDVLDFASNAKVFSFKSVSALNFTISFIANYKVNHG